jgi:V-type H+-transporting ATPase subunit B
VQHCGKDVHDNSRESFAIVFGTMGANKGFTQYFHQDFEQSRSMKFVVLFLNQANNPTVKRLITSRIALTIAEYLAYKKENAYLGDID